jgi:hypothetical protein
VYAETYYSSPELPYDPEPTPEERREEGSRRARKVDEEYDPSSTELEALAYALDSYAAKENFGTPYAGGYMEQSVRWRLAVECVARAVGDAKRDAQDMARFSC